MVIKNKIQTYTNDGFQHNDDLVLIVLYLMY